MVKTDSIVTTSAYLSKAFKDLKQHFIKFGRFIRTGFNKYSKPSNVMVRKLKIALLALVITILFILVRLHAPIDYDNVFLWGGVYFILGLFTWLGTIRVLRPVNKYTLFSVVSFPAIFVFMGTMVIHLIFLFDLARISYVLVFSILVLWFLLSTWVFMLMTNILNVNMQVFVPISKLAEGVLRLYVITTHVVLGFIGYILVTGQYLLFSFNSFWLGLGIFMLIWIWRGVYQYFSRDYSRTGIIFAIGVVIMLSLVTLILFAIVPNSILILIILLYLILRFFEYFIEDMHTVE